MVTRWLLWSAAAVLAASRSAAQAPPDVLMLTHANVIDGITPAPLGNMTVVLRDGRIERVSSTPIAPPPGARTIDVGGRWLLPGLIDAHAHLRDLASARAALRYGVTTARSLGVNYYVDVGVRDLHHAGAADLPDVIAAGYHVRRRVAEEFFLDAPGLRTLARGLSGPDDVRQVVAELVRHHVDVIKVMVTERAGLLDGDPLRRVLTDDEVRAAVEEATKAGLPVAAHAHTDEGRSPRFVPA
jgi:imidazolonepropionase-like amidohydrolase